jgi:hypothetical protein
MDWIDLAQDTDQWRALVNTVMKLRVPYNVRKFFISCTAGGYSSSANFMELVVPGFEMKFGFLWGEIKREINEHALGNRRDVSVHEIACFISETLCRTYPKLGIRCRH